MDTLSSDGWRFHSGRSVRERTRLILALVIGLALWALALCAQDPTKSAAPYFEIKGAAGADVFPLRSTAVEALLAGPIAEVQVRQTYRNDGNTPLEARYVFPGSTRAAVHALSMQIGARKVEAVIREKNEARKTYQAAKAQGRTAALLEAERSNVFAMHVGHILPGDEVTVELRYTEMLVPEEGRYEWVFPTVVGPRYGAFANAEKTEETDTSLSASEVIEPLLTLTAEIVAGVPVQSWECPSHRVTATPIDGRYRVVLTPTEGPQMDRDFILRYRLAGEAVTSGLLIDEWRGEHYFLLTLQPPARVQPAQIPPRDYLFIVDVSGSMRGFPLFVTKKLLRELLVTLRAEDTFNVLLFAGASEMLAQQSLPASPEAIAAAVALLERQSGGGGTELLPALRRALDSPRPDGVARSVVLVTDGYVSVENEACALVRRRLGEANLFTFGIGSAVNRELIERLARAGRAEPAIIENETRAEAGAEAFRRRIEAPVLTQVRTDFSGLAVHSLQPEVLPDVFAQRPVVVVGKFSGTAQGRIAVSGVTGGGPWRGEIDLAQAVSLGGSGILAQLWARERLEHLRDRHALGDQPAERRAEIVALGLQYNLLTPFTSFVAVDTVVRPAAADAARSVAVSTALPAGMATEGENVPTTPEPATVSLIVVAAIVVAWGVWRERRQPTKAAKGKDA